MLLVWFGGCFVLYCCVCGLCCLRCGVWIGLLPFVFVFGFLSVNSVAI